MARPMIPGRPLTAAQDTPREWRSLGTHMLLQIASPVARKLPEMWTSSDRPRRVFSYLIYHALDLFWVVVLCFICELIIRGLYTGLKHAGVEFLSSIVGMVIVFWGMLLLGWLFPRSEDLYAEYVRSKVDFINQNLGVGFPVPIVVFTTKEHIHNVGAVIGNFFATASVFWVAIFLISWAAVFPSVKSRPENRAIELEDGGSGGPDPTCTTNSDTPQLSYPSSRAPTLSEAPLPSSNPAPKSGSTPASAASSVTAVEVQSPPSRLCPWAPVLMTLLFVLLVGLPIALAANEHRPLDLSVLWLAWVASVKGQAALRRLSHRKVPKDITRIVATFLNPVLLTTVIMTGYTRIKESAMRTPLDHILKAFSSGTTLAQLWSMGKLHSFGAGDAALSLLEVGIVVWGFKLHECRHELFSLSGFLIVLVSLLCAVFSAFVSIAMARAMNIGGNESLTFASRSTTLALAKPSTTALGGSEMINACLVVGNGIFGQLLAPWFLRALRIRDRPNDVAGNDRKEGGSGRGGGDSAVEVAAGATVGMNGAAMGVSYLYERKSRAAPYAALSMTAFGVGTTILASVGPFQEALRSVAGV